MLETICETLVEAYRRNWITSRDGNVSIRHHDRDHFYITPSGVRKQTLQPDQFKKIRLVNSISALTAVGKARRASAGPGCTAGTHAEARIA